MQRYFTILLCFCSGWLTAQEVVTSDFIRVDQFGYLPEAVKVAVVVDPQTGFDSQLSFAPGAEYQVRRADDGTVVFSGEPKAWNNGATDPLSGDRAWWFDFSAVQTPGSYYVYDVANRVASFRFDIGPDVYADALRAAVRMFYYNRCNHEKKAEHAGVNWADGPSFVGPNQDKAARSVTDRNNAATARDLSGGWWDAGDYNKYVTFARETMHLLLESYEQKPAIWGDNYQIPESGNGVPDLLDEVKWELEWLKKMQLPDGSGLVKMGLIANAPGATLPPSTDARPRYYYPIPCSAATIALASMFAHGAVVYAKIPGQEAFAADLKERAARAFRQFQTVTPTDLCDNGTIEAGDADVSPADQGKIAVEAAVYLYAATGEATYRDFVDANYKRLNNETGWWGPYQYSMTSALLYYARISGATASTASDVVNRKRGATNQDFYKWNDKDPYRAFMRNETYHWGSLMVRGVTGLLNYDLIQHQIDEANHPAYRQRAEELLHYFHGINPFNQVYLTNMGVYGAEKSLDEVYHSWFKDGSAWDNVKTSAKGGPAPGYVPGGPNKSYKPGQGACIMTPPCNQPPQKSYRNWNGIWPDASWEVTEPAIYYQAAYVKLLSKFATAATGPVVIPGGTGTIRTQEPARETPGLRVAYQADRDNLRLQWETSLAGDAHIAIFDAQGRLLQSQQLQLDATERQAQTQQTHWQNGAYVVTLTTAGQRLSRQFVVAR